MRSGYAVRKNEYYDSVFLMGVNKRLAEAPGVEQTAVLMCTEANKRLLAGIGIAGHEINAAGPNDLVVAVIADKDAIVESVIGGLDGLLKSMSAGTRSSGVRTFQAAIAQKPGANLAVFSIPGEFVAEEARRALESGLHVFIFSSNVPLEQELALKQLGRERGLLVMGPDCGTSIIDGVGIGFANVIRTGKIGAVGPSGTGLQEFTTQVHNAGGGISHAIGTGSNDLSDAIGGLTTLAALQMLEADEGTEVIAIISKPPGAKALAAFEAQAQRSTKPLIGCFLGSDRGANEQEGVFQLAPTIDDAAALALQAAGIDIVESSEADIVFKKGDLEAIRATWPKEAKYLRGLFAGGTFCYQTQQILGAAGVPVYSNSPLQARFKLVDPDHSREHTVVDLGDERYTLGKPHPMIDGTERARRIMREAADPQVAILLLDFIFGYNASNDPVGDLLEALHQAREVRRKSGGEISIVASVCGTNDDPQDLKLQVKMLKESGAIVFKSSARAVHFCQQLLNL
jgi:FdrA protein